MNRTPSLVAILALVAFVPALADDPVLPVNPFADAKVGDWMVMVVTITPPDGSQMPPEATAPRIIEWRVNAVEGDDVVIAESEPGGTEVNHRTFSSKQAPTVRHYLQFEDGTEVAIQKTEDETRKLGDRELSCKKVTATEQDEEMRTTMSVWICPDVKGGGLVAVEASVQAPDGKVAVVFETKGFGHGDAAEWGKTRAEVEAEMAK